MEIDSPLVEVSVSLDLCFMDIVELVHTPVSAFMLILLNIANFSRLNFYDKFAALIALLHLAQLPAVAVQLLLWATKYKTYGNIVKVSTKVLHSALNSLTVTIILLFWITQWLMGVQNRLYGTHFKLDDSLKVNNNGIWFIFAHIIFNYALMGTRLLVLIPYFKHVKDVYKPSNVYIAMMIESEIKKEEFTLTCLTIAFYSLGLPLLYAGVVLLMILPF